MSTDTQSLTGRELDALVAEKVMGWRRGNTKHGQYPWIAANGGQRLMVPEYSTDIAAAWLVVERMRGLGFYFECGDVRQSSLRFARFWKAGQYRRQLVGQADTDALAICRAALTAVGAA